MRAESWLHAADQWLKTYDANRADTAWNQGFQDKQFGANRADTAWNQGFQEKQLGETQRQFDTNQGNWNKDFARQNALDQWSQAFQQAGFDWQKQRAGETDNLQRELASMGAFGRKFGPNISAM